MALQLSRPPRPPRPPRQSVGHTEAGRRSSARPRHALGTRSLRRGQLTRGRPAGHRKRSMQSRQPQSVNQSWALGLSFPLTFSLSLSQSLFLTHFLFLPVTLSLFFSTSMALPLSISTTFPLSISLPPSFTHSSPPSLFSFSFSLSLTYTLTLTYTHSHSHTNSLSHSHFHPLYVRALFLNLAYMHVGVQLCVCASVCMHVRGCCGGLARLPAPTRGSIYTCLGQTRSLILRTAAGNHYLRFMFCCLSTEWVRAQDYSLPFFSCAL